MTWSIKKITLQHENKMLDTSMQTGVFIHYEFSANPKAHMKKDNANDELT